MEYEINQFGYDLIRNDVLKDILGKEHDSILYWIGKNLARKYPVNTNEELQQFFINANWGTLLKTKEKKKEMTFELTGPWMGKQDDRCYQLEAGFIAEQLEQLCKCMTGAMTTVKKNKVIVDVQLDRHDVI